MDSSLVETIQERMARLERECRAWRLAALGGLAIATMVGATHLAAAGIIIRTQKVVLTDRAGQERGLFDVSPTEGPSLVLRDKSKRPRIWLRLSGPGESGQILFLDENGRTTATIP